MALVGSANSSVNALRQALVVDKGSNGLEMRGRSLYGARIAKTFTHALSGRENPDRFRTTLIEPEVQAHIAFTIDFSGSMSGGGRAMGNFEQCALASVALSRVCDTLGVTREIYAVDFGSQNGAQGASVDFDYMLHPLVERNEKFTEKLLEEAWRLSPGSGTHVAAYLEAAIMLCERSRARKRLAVFLTDGHCSSVRLLPSLAEQARAKGIECMGIVMGMGSPAREIPNGIAANSPQELLSGIAKHMAKVLNESRAF